MTNYEMLTTVEEPTDLLILADICEEQGNEKDASIWRFIHEEYWPFQDSEGLWWWDHIHTKKVNDPWGSYVPVEIFQKLEHRAGTTSNYRNLPSALFDLHQALTSTGLIKREN